MIYLMRGHAETVAICCCETEAMAQRRYATGWRQITREMYMFYWDYFARLRLQEMKEAAKGQEPRERVVGDIWQ